MKMMSIVILLILLVVSILFIGQTTITISPFSIHLDAWANVLGVLFLGVAICCFDYQTAKETKAKVTETEYSKGYNDGIRSANQACDTKQPLKDECKSN